tara:strand:+ start:6582 stop:6818 length:237 start_codon:yes stop_codon:yes gene_type:complete
MKAVVENVNLVISSLTGILVGLLGLGIVSNILFGSTIFIGDVIGNISSIVASLGSQGLVGLIVAIIVIHILGIGDSKK